MTVVGSVSISTDAALLSGVCSSVTKSTRITGTGVVVGVVVVGVVVVVVGFSSPFRIRTGPEERLRNLGGMWEDGFICSDLLLTLTLE